MEKKTHKYTRSLKDSAQFRKCDGKRCDNAENVSFFWKNVDCPKCRKAGGKE